MADESRDFQIKGRALYCCLLQAGVTAAGGVQQLALNDHHSNGEKENRSVMGT